MLTHLLLRKEPCLWISKKWRVVQNVQLRRELPCSDQFWAVSSPGLVPLFSMLPFVCIWLVIRDLIQAFAAGDISRATESTRYAWIAVVFAAASILIYFIALNCTHLAAFRTATNMRKTAIHHIVTLPLGYFSQKCQWTAAENH